MRVTGDEEGVRYLQQMYVRDKKNAMGYLRGGKQRGVAYFRAVKGERYILYEIRYKDGDVYHVSRFQEGSRTQPT